MTAALEGGVSGQQHAPAALYPGKGPVPILQEAEWAPGPVWTGGNSRPHRDSIPDRPAHIRYTDWATGLTDKEGLHKFQHSQNITKSVKWRRM